MGIEVSSSYFMYFMKQETRPHISISHSEASRLCPSYNNQQGAKTPVYICLLSNYVNVIISISSIILFLTTSLALLCCVLIASFLNPGIR